MNERYNKYYGAPNRKDYVTYLFHSKHTSISFGVHYNEAGEVCWVHDMQKMINVNKDWTVGDSDQTSTKEEFEEAYKKAIKFLTS